MKFAIGLITLLPLCVCMHGVAGQCQYLELRGSGSTRDGASQEVPMYLAYPDSIGSIAVKPFLESNSEKARAIFHSVAWQAHPLTPAQDRFLLALRDFVDGKIGEAGKGLTASTASSFRSCKRIDAALMLFYSGFPADAEKDWQHELQASGIDEPRSKSSAKKGRANEFDCAEGAWRNLYSLYLGRREFDKAHGLVDEVLKAAPKNKWAILAKGYLLRMVMPDQDWGEYLKEKSSWKDSLFEIQIAYGRFLKEQGQSAEAVKYYTRGLEGAPANGPGWLELADIYHDLGYYVFSEQCIRKSFDFGIQDPYIFELYARVLRDATQFAESGRAEDAEWARRSWNLAERILEEGFPHDLGRRSMAQLLYHVYCHNGKVEAANNLKDSFWFHFSNPAPPHNPQKLGPNWNPYRPELRITLTENKFSTNPSRRYVRFFRALEPDDGFSLVPFATMARSRAWALSPETWRQAFGHRKATPHSRRLLGRHARNRIGAHVGECLSRSGRQEQSRQPRGLDARA